MEFSDISGSSTDQEKPYFLTTDSISNLKQLSLVLDTVTNQPLAPSDHINNHTMNNHQFASSVNHQNKHCDRNGDVHPFHYQAGYTPPGHARTSGLLRSLLVEFGGQSSVHGIKHVVNLKKRFNSYTWKNCVYFVFVLLCFATAVYTLHDVIKDYNLDPVTSHVTSHQAAELEFPAVTVCNINKIRYEQNFTDSGALYVEVTEGHVLSDMLLHCTFGGAEVCNDTAFYWSYVPRFGNCYTYNFHLNNDGSPKQPRSVTSPGALATLSLSLDIYYDEYAYTTTGSGVVVDVHQPNTEPDLGHTHVVAAPGYHTVLNMQKTLTTTTVPPSSSLVSYEVTSSSSSEWPGIYSNEAQWLFAIYGLGGDVTLEEDYTYVRRNSLQLDVVMATMVVEEHLSSPKYTWSVLLSHVGGVFGLFLGCSVIILVEVAELVLDVTMHVWQRMKSSKGGVSPRGMTPTDHKAAEMTSMPPFGHQAYACAEGHSQAEA